MNFMARDIATAPIGKAALQARRVPLCGAHPEHSSGPVGFGNGVRLKQPGARATYRANSSCTQRRPIERPFSVSADLARLSRRMQECERRCELAAPTCALPQEALSRHRQAPPSSTRLIQAEKLLLWGSWLPPVQATPRLPHHCKPDIFGRATPDWARQHFFVRSSPQCGSGPARSATAPRARLYRRMLRWRLTEQNSVLGVHDWPALPT
jgi:hypothetical protein